MHINLFDSHVHSDNSPDGHSPISLLCEKAVELGLSGLAITDHCDINLYEEEQFELRMRQSFFESLIAREVFQNKLIVSLGIELGQPLDSLENTQRALTRNPYDFVLAGLHFRPNNGEDFYYIDFTREDPYAFMEEYYQQVYRTVQWNGFDALAHLDYPLRYIEGRWGVSMDLSRFTPIVDEILKLLAQNGKALEINTAALRRGVGRITPTLEQLKRFREFGGEYVTLGSDAHQAECVGGCLQDGMELLTAAGYREFTFYRKRKPCLLRII